MNSSEDNVYMSTRRLCDDKCAKEARDLQNESIVDYDLYQYLPAGACDGINARFPTMAYDHVNLTGRIGYGVAEGCVVDNYSALRNDPAQMTRDKCRQQLYTRMFQGCPNLSCGVSDPDSEMPILQGSSTTDYEGVKYPCKKSLMEKPTYVFDPLLDCVKKVQDEKHIVESWTRGGSDTRNYMLRQEYLKSCGVGVPGQIRGNVPGGPR